MLYLLLFVLFLLFSLLGHLFLFTYSLLVPFHAAFNLYSSQNSSSSSIHLYSCCFSSHFHSSGIWFCSPIRSYFLSLASFNLLLHLNSSSHPLFPPSHVVLLLFSLLCLLISFIYSLLLPFPRNVYSTSLASKLPFSYTIQSSSCCFAFIFTPPSSGSVHLFAFNSFPSHPLIYFTSI